MKLFLILFFYSTFTYASLNDEVNEIAKLRQEVELLSNDVENLKKSQQSQMDVYIQRDQEISAQLLKEKFRQDQLKMQIKSSSDKLEEYSKKALKKGSDEWLKEFWIRYERSLKLAHPLYRQKLLERISKLKVDLQFKKISYEHALLQTWFVLENDLNKSQDTEFVLSPLEMNGKLHHVEMVRLGRNKGYFRTAEGTYGLLSFNTQWETRFFEDASSKEMIETLLAQFKQQQKTGLFTLPGIKL
ncbi:MAG: DUF3450 family protein [Bacteriovoracaceae bacterium]